MLNLPRMNLNQIISAIWRRSTLGWPMRNQHTSSLENSCTWREHWPCRGWRNSAETGRTESPPSPSLETVRDKNIWEYSFPFLLFHSVYYHTRDTCGEPTCTVLRYCRVKYQSWEAVSSNRNWNPAEVMHGASPTSLTERAKQKHIIIVFFKKARNPKLMFTSSWGRPGWGAARGPGWPRHSESPPWSAGWPPSAPWHSGPGSLRPVHADQDQDCCPRLPMAYHWSTEILK